MGMDLELSTDRAAIVVPPVGRLVETDEEWEPYRLVDGEGSAVAAVAAWFSELQAAGRSVATLRSYGMDLLRWSRFLWAVGVPWDRATRAEARDFSRWLQLGGAPKRPHWRHPEGPVPPGRTGPYGSVPRLGASTARSGAGPWVTRTSVSAIDTGQALRC